MNITVKASEFVTRQVKGTGKTYSELFSFDQIADIAKEELDKKNFTNGYRKGVIVITISDSRAKKFICPLVKINDHTKLKARIVRRRPEEEPYIQIRALNGENLKTNTVDLVLYHKDVLDETKERSTDADWELIAFMAIPDGIKMPMGPVTMMRNQLQKPGGTKGTYQGSEWADSVDFWQQYSIKD